MLKQAQNLSGFEQYRIDCILNILLFDNRIVIKSLLEDKLFLYCKQP